jgi:nitroreductase
MQENEVLKAIRGRRSVIRFSDSPVSEELLEAILEAGRWAPSYINSQPWEFIVVRDSELRARAAEILRRVTISWQGFGQAPVILVVAVDAGKDPRHHIEDGAAAAQNMALMAHSLGLATFWAGVYGGTEGKGSPEEELRSLLLLPRGHRIVAALPVGFPAYEAKASRRPLGEMVHANRFAGGASAAR